MECQSVSALHGKLKSFLAASAAAFLLAALPAAAQSTTGILLEVWTGISGTQVSNLTSNANYPNTPNTRIWPGLFEIPSQGDNYGTRARAFIRPPTTGNYTFWIAGDDDCELWLSPDDNAGGITRIANVSGWTNSREWTRMASQQSAAISLTAGRRYYIETRHKEGTGGDHLAVGWQGPGITGDAERPIPGSRLTPYVIGNPPAITAQPGNAQVNVGGTATFTVTASGAATLTYQWRKNGSNISGATASMYTIPPAVASDNGAQFSVVASNGSGSATSVNAILTVSQPPVITAQPQNATVNVGQSAVFSVSATGSAPIAYQWRKNGVNISGANSSTYSTPAATAGDNGAQFSVEVSNVAGTVPSANAILTVNQPPVIVTQPVGATVNPGQTATFSVTATGTAPLAYQWRKNGSNISGAVSPAYTTPAAVAADNGAQFSVVVSNGSGSVPSANAILTVTQVPVIVVPPASQTVNVGQTATFTVTATGATGYQWRKGGVNISGATAASYTTPPATLLDNGSLFSVALTNASGTVTSPSALLTVNQPPAIITQPVGATVNAGQTATFTVAATGVPSPSFQWRKNGSNIPGATLASYTTPATVAADNGAQFSVVASNIAGTATSVNALLTVTTFTLNNKKISISGELVDAAGNPLGYPTPIDVDVVVRLLNDAVGGTALYTEEFRAAAGKAVRVVSGLFVARLGEGATTGNLQQIVAANANLWVEITIDDGTPDVLTPRTPLTASAYALGGTPAAAAAGLSGAGNPNAAGIQAAVGATYVNTSDNTTWFKLETGWKLLD